MHILSFHPRNCGTQALMFYSFGGGGDLLGEVLSLAQGHTASMRPFPVLCVVDGG